MTQRFLKFGLAVPVTALCLAGASLNAQDTNNTTQSQSAQVQTGTTNAAPSNTSATGQPLSTQSNEGFWGHLNPFARKKWVKRQIDPVKDRLNELDELNAKNANEIKDVDARAQAGIHKAQDTADQASQQASAAGSTANQAQQTAQQASAQTDKLSSTVSNLDQYNQVSDTEIRFRPGQTALNEKAKDALDQIASQLKGQKGYLVEVQGYTHTRGQAGVEASQRLTNSVVRYLVEQHQIPVYRIHQLGLGNAPEGSDGTKVTGSVVHVTLVQNSLAALNSTTNSGSSPIGATQNPAQPSPQGAASQPTAQQ